MGAAAWNHARASHTRRAEHSRNRRDGGSWAGHSHQGAAAGRAARQQHGQGVQHAAAELQANVLRRQRPGGRAAERQCGRVSRKGARRRCTLACRSNVAMGCCGFSCRGVLQNIHMVAPLAVPPASSHLGILLVQHVAHLQEALRLRKQLLGGGPAKAAAAAAAGAGPGRGRLAALHRGAHAAQKLQQQRHAQLPPAPHRRGERLCGGSRAGAAASMLGMLAQQTGRLSQVAEQACWVQPRCLPLPGAAQVPAPLPPFTPLPIAPRPARTCVLGE